MGRFVVYELLEGLSIIVIKIRVESLNKKIDSGDKFFSEVGKLNVDLLVEMFLRGKIIEEELIFSYRDVVRSFSLYTSVRRKV